MLKKTQELLQQRNPELVISLGVSKKLEQYFGNDPNSDVTIQVKDKQYRLQKAFLRIESEYFQNLFQNDP